MCIKNLIKRWDMCVASDKSYFEQHKENCMKSCSILFYWRIDNCSSEFADYYESFNIEGLEENQSMESHVCTRTNLKIKIYKILDTSYSWLEFTQYKITVILIKKKHLMRRKLIIKHFQQNKRAFQLWKKYLGN